MVGKIESIHSLISLPWDIGNFGHSEKTGEIMPALFSSYVAIVEINCDNVCFLCNKL